MPKSTAEIAFDAAIKYPMPAVMYQLLTLNETIPGAARVLPSVIRLDHDLERRMMAVVRSEGPWQGISSHPTLDDGLAALGFRRAHATALLTTTVRTLPIQTKVIDYLDFWRSSVSVAFLSSALAHEGHSEHQEYAFAAGLLHDVGRLLMDETAPQTLATLQSEGTRNTGAWHELEHAAFGYTALDLTVELLRAWRFPPALIDGIASMPDEGRSGLSDVLRQALVAAHGYGFATPAGRSQMLKPDSPRHIERYFNGAPSFTEHVDALLESAVVNRR